MCWTMGLSAWAAVAGASVEMSSMLTSQATPRRSRFFVRGGGVRCIGTSRMGHDGRARFAGLAGGVPRVVACRFGTSVVAVSRERQEGSGVHHGSRTRRPAVCQRRWSTSLREARTPTSGRWSCATPSTSADRVER
ncbi:hypothetical protein MILUP08_42958 [Micromonospora lupini str. Lupac 08]|uniref:Uncharacterized protein n=1 Tax=Micromonospora lupini str. Lupac 08 TaxID=1150864 RepID=I0L2H9_9ACTN|nr:hypothetical protein MILUP08_42958 [Micromonospora lupini str. Lupac 08]